MSVLSSFWNEFLAKLEKEQVRIPVLYSILKHVKPLDMTDEKIIVSCENQGAKIFLEQRKVEVEREIFGYAQKNLAIDFVLAPPKKKKLDSPLLSFEPTPEDLYTKCGLNHKYSFDNFAVSGTNQVAYAASQAVVNNPGSAYNPLFLYGGVGVGKTHLAQAVAKKILEADKSKKVYFCPGDNFTNEMIESIRERTTAKFRRKYRYLNLLIVDDIQFIAGKEAVQEEFFHTFNSIVSAGGQIILTSDRPPTAIKNLEDRLRSRFSGGLTVDVQEPDLELRTAILLIKAKEKNIGLDIEAAKIISERILDSRALEGVLLSIYAKILGVKDTIDLDTVESFFVQKQDNKAKRMTPSDVIRAVCTYYNVKPSHIRGETRVESIVLPRQVAMYLIRRELKLKLVDTAEQLRRKDHTTVLHAEHKISQMMMRDQNFKKEIDSIVQTLESST